MFVGEGSILSAIKKEDLNIMEYINFMETLASFSKSSVWKSLISAVEGDTNGSTSPPLPPRKSKSAGLMEEVRKGVKLRKVDESEKNKYFNGIRLLEELLEEGVTQRRSKIEDSDTEDDSDDDFDD